VFGHSQVNEAVDMVGTMLYQELHQFAERLALIAPLHAESLFDYLADALLLPPIDMERHERIGRMMRAIMGDDTAT
jgi:hypothetical protein